MLYQNYRTLFYITGQLLLAGLWITSGLSQEGPALWEEVRAGSAWTFWLILWIPAFLVSRVVLNLLAQVSFRLFSSDPAEDAEDELSRQLGWRSGTVFGAVLALSLWSALLWQGLGGPAWALQAGVALGWVAGPLAGDVTEWLLPRQGL